MLGDNGILNKATVASNKSIVGQEKEQVQLAYSAVSIDKDASSITESDLQAELNNTVGLGKTTVSSNDEGGFNVYYSDTKHTYSIYRGIVSEIVNEDVPQGKVARIGTSYYETLQAALNAVPSNNTKTEVILLTDISENTNLDENKNVLLNLNNKKITNVENELEGVWEDEHYTYYEPAVIINPNATLEIKNGTIEAPYGNTISNQGTLLITSGTYIQSGTDPTVIYSVFNNNNGTLTIDNGHIMGEISANNNSVITLNNGIFEDYIGNFASEIIIRGGEYSHAIGPSYEGGTIDIYDGTFTACLYSPDNIYGGTFICNPANCFQNEEHCVLTYSGSTTNIYGGTFSGGTTSSLCAYGTINFYGGTFDTKYGSINMLNN